MMLIMVIMVIPQSPRDINTNSQDIHMFLTMLKLTQYEASDYPPLVDPLVMLVSDSKWGDDPLNWTYLSDW